MTWVRVFLIVTCCSLLGMCLGGLFGFSAGKLAPTLFFHLIPWHDVEPLGAATVLGSTAGVLLGGSLGCFGILIQLIFEWRKPAEKT